MIYQVTANLFFEDEDEAKDFYRDCELAFEKSTTINPNTINIEFGLIQLLKNNHTQNPNEPCFLMAHKNTLPE